MDASDALLTLGGAVALMLWGVRMVRTGMTRAFGTVLRRYLAQAGDNRFKAFATGLGVTAVLQSATATALLVSSFAGRAAVTLPVAIAMMLGADVGSTLVAQVFAFDVKWLWALGVLAGFIVFSASDEDKAKSIGRMLIGLGLMLLSLTILSQLSAGMRQSPLVRALLGGLSNEPVIAFLVAALLTWLAHSSLAVVLLIMSLAASGVVAPHGALAMVLGANVGGAIAPYMAQISGLAAARRVPLANLIARAAVAIALLPLVHVLLAGLGRLSSSSQQIVLNGHLAFNIIVALVWMPLTSHLATLVTRLLPEPPPEADRAAPLHLDKTALDVPSEALACAMRETLHVGDLVLDMLKRSQAMLDANDLKAVKAIERADDDVDRLHEAIKHYLVRTSKADMTDDESRRYIEVLTFNTNLEHIGDIIDKNLMELVQKRLKKRAHFSAEGHQELTQLHKLVIDNMRLALNVFATRDLALARRLQHQKTVMRIAEAEASEKHFARLRQGRSESIETSSIHLDVIRDLKRINSHIASVAYPILEAAGELKQQRKLEHVTAALPIANESRAENAPAETQATRV
jgi:phosphate:Na+ symporter